MKNCVRDRKQLFVACNAISGYDGRYKNREKGTFRNIPEHNKLKQLLSKKKKKEIERT